MDFDRNPVILDVVPCGGVHVPASLKARTDLIGWLPVSKSALKIESAVSSFCR